MVKKEILTIENNGPVGYLISNVLKKHYAVTRTFSCAEAMKELQSNNETDLIILDIPNDKSDNYKLLQHISTSSVLGTIRTVVISNSDDPSLKHKTAELGVSLFLTKPFDPVYLSDKVRELVNVYSNKGTRKRRIPFNLNIF
ncbi:MAG TPA: response regulator [Ferruginibacter sp.]|nr:response regulator [Bacteroidota bacterium]MCC6692332.1 response regulator [Chitinophagaceae bacterium]HMT95148.1 response regulator [Ferruginibacter sp.]HMU24951.1 response regulator [Ferruginibacter sp.]